MMKEFVSRISNLSARAAFIRRALLVSFLLLTVHGSHSTAHCSTLAANSAWRKQQTGTFAWLHSVFFVDESEGWAVGGKGALLHTSDGGVHWELRPRFVEDAMQDVFFTDARTG